MILVRDTKFCKGRNLPVSASTIAALATYARRRDRRRPATTRLFVSLSGTPVAYSHFGATFRAAVRASGIGAGFPSQPRIHDLRHAFAVRTLLGWYRAGLDVEALLPAWPPISGIASHGPPTPISPRRPSCSPRPPTASRPRRR